MEKNENYAINVIMDSGKEFVVAMHVDDFMKEIHNQVGILKNTFMKYDNVYFNPSHISSIERLS